MSIIDKYRKSQDLQDYIQEHQEFEGKINDLKQERQELFEQYAQQSPELDAMNREDDPEAYDEKAKELEDLGTELQDTDKRLEETQSDFDSFKENNQQFATAYEEAQEAARQIKEYELSNSQGEHSSEEIGHELKNQGIESHGETTQSNVDGNKIKVDGGYEHLDSSDKPSYDPEAMKKALDAAKEQGIKTDFSDHYNEDKTTDSPDELESADGKEEQSSPDPPGAQNPKPSNSIHVDNARNAAANKIQNQDTQKDLNQNRVKEEQDKEAER